MTNLSDSDKSHIRRFVIGGMIAVIAATISAVNGFAYLIFGPFALTNFATCFVITAALLILARAKAMRAAFLICGRLLPPAEALRWCGGTWCVLIPRRAVVLPPIK